MSKTDTLNHTQTYINILYGKSNVGKVTEKEKEREDERYKSKTKDLKKSKKKKNSEHFSIFRTQHKIYESCSALLICTKLVYIQTDTISP